MSDITEYKEIITRLHNVSHIPFSLVGNDYRTIFCSPQIDDFLLPISAVTDAIFDMKTEIADEYYPKMRTDSLNLTVGYFRIDADYLLFLGPCPLYELKLSDLFSVYGTRTSRSTLLRMYHVIEQSYVTGIVSFASILSLAILLFRHENIPQGEILSSNYDDVSAMSETAFIHGPQHSFWSISNINHAEKTFQNLIKNGDLSGLRTYWDNPNFQADSSISLNDVRAVYIILPILTVIRRSAIEAGANLNNTFLLYEKYTKKIPYVKTIGETYRLLQEATFDFCQMVDALSDTKKLPTICKECIAYIEDNLNTKLSSAQIARSCGISERQLYRIFEKNMHIPVTEFVRRERLDHAVKMLVTTDNSISDICAALGFTSHSHFSKSFHKTYGCTPSEYRNKHKSTS